MTECIDEQPTLSASLRKDGGIRPARNFYWAGVRSTSLQFGTSPNLYDTLQHSSSIYDQFRVWNGELGDIDRVERSGVGWVQEGLAQRWLHERSNQIVGLFSHESEDVSTYITSSESRQIPVGFDGGYLGVVVIEVAVTGSNEMLGDSATE